MTKDIRLAELFNSHKDELEQQLTGLLLPKDASKVQQTIANYLNGLFDGEGEFRQSLTQSEDYMLQAVLSLLNAQQEMSNNLIKQMSKITPDVNVEQETIKDKNFLDVKMNPTQSVVGSAGGALVGNLIWGGWGAVFGAIAGTAVAVYLASRSNQPTESRTKIKVIDQHLSSANINDLTTILSKVCSSVDDMIATFRAQINKVVSKYESQEKPSLESQYRPVVEIIQTLIGYSRTHADDEKFVKKICERIEDMSEVLDMYNLTVVDYSEEHDAWFEKTESPNTDEKKMVYPAIVKEGSVILMGKIFVPAQ